MQDNSRDIQTIKEKCRDFRNEKTTTSEIKTYIEFRRNWTLQKTESINLSYFSVLKITMTFIKGHSLLEPYFAHL